MVNLADQVMLTIAAKDNASNVAKNIDGSFQGMASNISKAMGSISNSMMNLSSVSDNAFQGLTGKSAMDNILGTTSKAETNSVLLKNMLDDTEKHYDSFYEKVDKTTDSSLTSMQELIPALKAFKSATGATDKEMTNITDEMANFGAAVLAQTGSTDLAQQSMMDLSKGVKGAFASLDQYGITQDALERTGYWNGDEKDVEGFMKAVQKVTGSTEELMETNTGLDALIGKAFSRAGKKMGNEFLPIIKDVKKGFLALDDSLGGNLSASILATGGAIEVMNQGLWNVSTTVNGIKDLKTAFSSLKDVIISTGKAAEATSDALNMGSNISQIGADVSSAGTIAKESKNGGIKSFSQEITEAAFFANSGFGNEKNTLKALDNAIDSQEKIGAKKSEYSKIVKEVSKEDWGLTDAIKHNYNKSMNEAGEAIYDGVNSLAEKPQKINGKIKSAGKSLNDSFDSFSNSLKTIKEAGIKGNFKKIDKSLYQSLNGTSNTVDTLESVADMGDNAGDAVKAVKGIEKVEDATETVVEGAGAIGALAPEATAAGAEVGATASATTTLSGAFTSMIVPLLAISAVIIIMLPIVALIAAEAMVLLKLLGEFMQSLDFGSLDLSSSIEGIKSIAEGLAWVGVAMAAMTFTSIMTGLAVMTSGFLGITTPLEVAKDALLKASNILKEFSNVSIDPSVATNLKTISDGLKSVSDAMLGLTSVTITTGFSDFIAWAFQFGSVTDALEKAKTEIINASTKLNEFSGITPLDQATADKIQNVCDSLASVGNAMEALRSMRDGQNWDNIFGSLMDGIFGKGFNIQQALDAVKGDIISASSALSTWTGLEGVPKDVGTKIKSVADTLTSVSEAFQTLRKLRDDTNWDGFVGGIFGGTDIAVAITNVGNQIRQVSTRLASLSTIAWVDDSISEKINKLNTTLGNVSNAVTSMKSLPSMEGFDMGAVNAAVTNVRNVATQLSTLSNITLGGDSTTVLGTMQTALESLKATLSAASGFSAPATSIGTQIVTGVKSGLSPLSSTVTTAVSSATASAASAGWTGGAYIGTSTTNGFRSALNLHTVMSTEMGYVKTAVDNGISAAKSAAQNGAKEIVSAFQSGINVGSPGDIARTMSGEMNYTLEAIKNSYSNLRSASSAAARNIVSSFGNPSLNIGPNNKFTSGQIGSLQTLMSQVPNISSGGNVTIIIGEGAVTVDARNKTEREAQQILITALESLDTITDIKVNGE